MLFFENDYSTATNVEILKKIEQINSKKLSGYGTDEYCTRAKEKIKKVLKTDDIDVYFFSWWYTNKFYNDKFAS